MEAYKKYMLLFIVSFAILQGCTTPTAIDTVQDELESFTETSIGELVYRDPVMQSAEEILTREDVQKVLENEDCHIEVVDTDEDYYSVQVTDGMYILEDLQFKIHKDTGKIISE